MIQIMSNVFELLSKADVVISLAAAFFAFLGWMKAKSLMKAQAAEKRLKETPIQISLVCNGSKLALPYKPLRQSLTRAEVAGVIGMYALGRRYNVPALGKVFSAGTFDEVLKGKSNQLEIPASQAELLMFVVGVLEASEKVSQGLSETDLKLAQHIYNDLYISEIRKQKTLEVLTKEALSVSAQ